MKCCFWNKSLLFAVILISEVRKEILVGK